MVLYPNKLPESERVCSGICISNIKVETYQIRNILKRNWRLTPTDNSLAYSTFIKNFPPGPPYREEKKTGRYYTITKEFLRKFR